MKKFSRQFGLKSLDKVSIGAGSLAAVIKFSVCLLDVLTFLGTPLSDKI